MKIDLFLPPKSQYGVLSSFTKSLASALQRQAVKTEVLESVKNDPGPFLEKIASDRPDFTLSFNGVLPSEKGVFLCDLLKIPHIAYLVDSPGEFLPLIPSQKTSIACIDRNFVDFFQMAGAANSFFLPHAVDNKIKPDTSLQKKYPCVMTASCIDYEEIRKFWKENTKPFISNALDEASEEILSSSKAWSIPTFLDAIERQKNRGVSFELSDLPDASIFYLLEQYVTGKERIELISSLKEIPLHVFGKADFPGGWQKYIDPKSSLVTFHDAVSFEEAIEIMKTCQIVLHSCPKIKNGSHERVLTAMAAGALVVSSENQFLENEFPESMIFFKRGKWEALNISLHHYLNNENERLKLASSGSKKVHEHHTWDVRAKQLVDHLQKDLFRN